MKTHRNTPVVLVIGGNDPVGGAGLCADIQALAGMGCHAAPVVTAVTRQNSCGVTGYMAIDADLIGEQIACVLDDISVAAIKTGMLASSATVERVSALITEMPGIPLIVDPVLASNLGNKLSEGSLVDTMLERLVPLASILTPNIPELQTLAASNGQDNVNPAQLSSDLDADILLTGAHDKKTEKVINSLHRIGHDVLEWQWNRLPGEYHGSGCTLASALAAGLAHGFDKVSAAEQAQEYTWQALKHGLDAGRCQRLPNRIARQAINR